MVLKWLSQYPNLGALSGVAYDEVVVCDSTFALELLKSGNELVSSECECSQESERASRNRKVGH